MLLRQATQDDAEAIVRIQVAAWRAAYAGLMPQAYLDRMDHAARLASWRRALAEPGPRSIVAAVDACGMPVGFSVHGPEPDAGTGELIAVNVLPERWSQGYGGALCRQALEDGLRHGWLAMILWVLRENARARAAYAALGYTPDGESRIDTSLVGAPLCLLRYRRKLGDSP